MTIELMDGATGSKHISSEDWTVFNVATYGASEAVFDWGNKFKLTMSTANAGSIATGAGLVDGKRVWIKSPESITVTSGSQGMKRNDVVGIRYETYQSGSATLERPVVKVIKGTPNATTAADPSIPDKFLALWRVPLDGIAVGEPVALFDVMESIKGFRDSVSHQLVECGHSDGWFWRKYPDGTCVMDGKLTVRATGGTAWGNVWYDSAIRGGEGLPFALKSLTVGTVNVVGGNGSFWATQATSGTPTTAPTWYAVRATKGTSAVNLQAAYHIVGTWK